MNPKTMNFSKLREATGRTQKVMLVALVQEEQAKILEWLDPYSEEAKKGIARSFDPRLDEDNAVLYEVPAAYARRLLAGEPYKYKLVSPDIIRVPVTAPGGGRELRTITSVVKKRGTIKRKNPETEEIEDVEDQVLKSDLGVPLWIDPEDQE